jgi:hypothetical protein
MWQILLCCCCCTSGKGYPTLKVYHKGEEVKAYRGGGPPSNLLLSLPTLHTAAAAAAVANW